MSCRLFKHVGLKFWEQKVVQHVECPKSIHRSQHMFAVQPSQEARNSKKMKVKAEPGQNPLRFGLRLLWLFLDVHGQYCCLKQKIYWRQERQFHRQRNEFRSMVVCRDRFLKTLMTCLNTPFSLQLIGQVILLAMCVVLVSGKKTKPENVRVKLQGEVDRAPPAGACCAHQNSEGKHNNRAVQSLFAAVSWNLQMWWERFFRKRWNS